MVKPGVEIVGETTVANRFRAYGFPSARSRRDTWRLRRSAPRAACRNRCLRTQMSDAKVVLSTTKSGSSRSLSKDPFANSISLL